MNVKNIELHFENGESKTLDKAFAITIDEQQMNAYFTEMNAFETLQALHELTYEITHIIKNGEVSEGAEGTKIQE